MPHQSRDLATSVSGGLLRLRRAVPLLIAMCVLSALALLPSSALACDSFDFGTLFCPTSPVPAPNCWVQPNWWTWTPPPVASISGDPVTYVGVPTQFDGSQSQSHGSPIVRYDWGYFGPMGWWTASTTDPHVTVTFSSPGWQLVWLGVYDAHGRASFDCRWILVQCDDTPPVAVLNAPASASVCQTVTLDGSGSYDRHGAIADYTWNFGDGTPNCQGTASTVKHAWHTAGTYTIKLKVTDYVGKINTTTKQIVITGGAPAQPQGLSAADHPNDQGGAADLAWTASTSSGVTGYKVYRSLNATGPFTTPVASLGVTTSYGDTGLTNGTTYYYAVSAVGSGGESLRSNVASVTPIDNLAPAVPVGLSATDVPADSGDAIRASWNANAEADLAGYKVTCYDGAAVVKTFDVSDGTTSRTFTGLTTGHTYTFRILAYDRAGNASAQSAAVSCAPIDQMAPAAPMGLIAMNETTDHRIIDLAWNANSESDLKGYYVYRRTSVGGVETQVGVVLAPATSFVDSSCVAGQQYYYSVRAFDIWGNISAASQSVVANATDNIPPLPVPSASASDISPDQGGSIQVAWLPSASPDTLDYVVECIDPSGVVVNRWTGSAMGCSFSGLVTGTRYSVVVYARDAALNVSAGSTPAFATPTDDIAPAAPGAPAATDVVPDDGGSIIVSWPENSEPDLAGYIVEITAPDGSTNSASVGLASSHQFDNLQLDASYSFSVKARDVHGNTSAASAVVSQTDKDELAPSPVTVSAADHPADQGGAIDVTWTASTSADTAGYKLYRDGAWLADVTGTSFADTVHDRDDHAYTIAAVDGSGNLSDVSNPAVAKAIDNIAPAAPTDVSASDVMNDEGGAVEVTFVNSPDSDIDNYEVTCFAPDGTSVAEQDTAAGDHATVFVGLTIGVEYSFRVVAIDTSGNRSELSAEAKATSIDNLAPAIPVGLSTTDVPADQGGALALTWTANTEPDLAGYRVYRAASEQGPWGAPISVPTTNSWTDDTATLGTTWYYAVSAVDSHGNASELTSASAGTSADNLAPAAPSDVSAADVPGDQGGAVRLAWTAPADPDVSSCSVYRSTSPSGPWGAAVATGLHVSSWTDSNATLGQTFYYCVTASDASANESEKSDTAHAASADNLAPAAPTGLAVSEVAPDQGGTLSLSWTANSEPDVTSYTIYRATDGGSATKLADSVTATSFIDAMAELGHVYTYAVTANDGSANESDKSQTVSASSHDEVAPATPAGLSAIDTPADEGGQVTLAWSANTDSDLSGYVVYRIDGSTATKLADVTGTSFVVDGLVDGTAYTFAVSAVDGSHNESPRSDTAAATPHDNLAPSAPGDVSAADVPGDSGGSIALAWSAASGASHYAVYRSQTSGSGYVKLADVTTSNYVDTTATKGTRFYYVVTALDSADNESGYSLQVDAVSKSNIAPNAPSTVSAADTPGDAGGSIGVSWSAVTDAATYTILRAAGSGSFEVLASGLVGQAYTDTTAVRGTAFRYVVVAVDSDGNASVPSAEASAASLDNIAPSPVVLTTCDGGDTLATLEWSAASDNVELAGYEIWMKEGIAGTWVKQAQIDATAYTRDGLLDGMTYYFKVRAVDADGNLGDFSGEMSATPIQAVAGAATLRIEDTDARVAYSGTWATLTNASYTNGTTHYSNTVGSRASLTFTGVGMTIRALSTQAVNRGLAKIYVDGVFKTYVDMYSAAPNLAYTMYDTGVLADGQHTLMIEVSPLKNGSSWDIALDVDCFDVYGVFPDQVAPAVPSGVSAVDREADQGGAVRVAWTANTEDDLSSYRVYRSAAVAGIYSLVGQVEAPSTSFVDTGLTNGSSYFYKVSALDSAANESPLSAPANATPIDNLAPATPTGFAAAAHVTTTGGEIALSWSANSEADVVKYRLYRATSASGPFAAIADVSSGTSYTDSGLANGTTYYYEIAAVDANANVSAQTSAVSAVPRDSVAPSAPVGVSAADKAHDTGGAIVVSWSIASENDVASYTVYRADVAGGPYTSVGDASGTSFTDTTVTNGITYYYVVAATDSSSNHSGMSAEVSAQAQDNIPVWLVAPAGVSAVDTPSNQDGSVDVAWTAVGHVGVAGYRVRAYNHSGTLVATVDAGSQTSASVSGLSNGVQYDLTVAAYDADGNESAPCASVSATPVDDLAPAVPAGLTAIDKPDDAGGVINVSWNANAANDAVAGYRLYRATAADGPFALVADQTQTTFTDSGRTNGVAYYYTVEAYDAAGNVGARAAAVPGTAVVNQDTMAPTTPALSFADRGDGFVSLSWAGSSDNVGVTGYEVWMKESVAGAWVKQADVTTSPYTKPALVNGMTYYFKVRAVDAAGNISDYSSVVSACRPSA